MRSESRSLKHPLNRTLLLGAMASLPLGLGLPAAAQNATSEAPKENPALSELKIILTQLSGEVFLDKKPIQKSTILRPGQIIETKKGGKATILFGRDSIAHIDEETIFEITQASLKERATEVKLPKGTTRILVRSGGEARQFKVRTRSATMGVRGTHILISSSDKPGAQPQFTTLEGRAFVEVPGVARPVSLPAGQTFTPPPPVEVKQAALPPAPLTLPESQIRKLAQSAQLPPPRMEHLEDLPEDRARGGDRPEAERDRNGGRRGNGDGNGGEDSNRRRQRQRADRGDRGPRATLQPGFGFGGNGNFGFSGNSGGALGSLAGAGGPPRDPTADAAGAVRFNLNLQIR